MKSPERQSSSAMGNPDLGSVGHEVWDNVARGASQADNHYILIFELFRAVAELVEEGLFLR